MSMKLTDSEYIRELLGRHGFRFSKSLGQNFLTAAWVPEDIAAAGVPEEGMGVLEVGPGIGCLTRELSKRAEKVVSIELDKALKPILAETLADCPNVEVLFGDALKLDLAALAEEKLGGSKRRCAPISPTMSPAPCSPHLSRPVVLTA
ncbi:MAG: rRNA adenine N-6-methyltransferase family protein [Oscillospiraceae bacterium]